MLNTKISTRTERPVVFTQHHPQVSDFSLSLLEPEADSAKLHDWFTRDYARFWNMGHYSQSEVASFYAKLNASGHAASYMGFFEGEPAFVVESYDPRHDQVGKHYDVKDGDWGMHFLVAPPRRKITGFTLAIIRTVLSFHFDNPLIKRLVVEPDVRNEKVHELNRKVGFISARTIELEEKTALLSFATRQDFYKTLEQDINA
ncbi:acetyltransferase [Rhizobium skierniewicense]|uniref:GNAT family N-acetyltransferase n=1 Tax=Rhizobium TaxID=379 RepID=UPI0005AF0283|nr:MULTISPECIES: GNAT family N-acetyltransferase [Rhizobium]MBD8687365.1 acetyltransferase [Rhizobium sp. CFBP 13644]MBD8691819.1 acetyltransferase [Rhizobium sp. CFBP 13717]MCI9866990.1 acetyltransferase [Rhizobium skierniewicense]